MFVKKTKYSLICFSLVLRASPVAQLAKNLPANTGPIGDAGSIPRLGRSSEEGNDNSHQYSCMENPMAEEPGGLKVEDVFKCSLEI